MTHSAGVGRADGRVARRRPLLLASTCTSATSTGSSRTSSPPSTCATRDCQNFVEVYDILHPLQPMEQPAPAAHQPVLPAPAGARRGTSWRRRLGASAVVRGQRRPARTGRDIPHARTTGRRRYWSPIVGAEAQVTRERVAHVRHDGAQAPRGQRPRRRRVPAGLTTGQRRQVRRLGHLLPAAGRTTAASAATSPSPGSAASAFQVGAQRQPRPGLAAPGTCPTTASVQSATSPPAPAASACGDRCARERRCSR